MVLEPLDWLLRPVSGTLAAVATFQHVQQHAGSESKQPIHS